MNLSKSKYTNACLCLKMLWLDTYKKDVKGSIDLNSVMDNGNFVHEVARGLLGSHVTIEFNNDLNIMVSDTKEYLKNKDIVICEASFIYKNNFCSVDILEKHGNDYILYEVKGSTEKKDIYITDISYQYYVLNKLGLNIKKFYLVYLNNKYIRKDKINLNELFYKVDVTQEVIDLQDEVIKKIKEINHYMKNKNEQEEALDMKCFKPYNCPFWTYCTRNLIKPNVFDINGMRKSTKIKLYKQNLISFEDLKDIQLNSSYKFQIDYELLKKDDYVNKNKIKEFLDELTYPLYFLDFETFSPPIPKFLNTRVYEKIPFQYSLHYIDENNELHHKEFLGTSPDPRRELAERLVLDIPKDVCVLAYNMRFERDVINNLANIYPDLKEHLLNINKNMRDLMIPFKNRDYYSRLMQGSYSIKYVLPALFPNDPSLDYHNLELVHNGGEAMSFYEILFEKDIKEQEYIRDRLLKYCFLDTYAMVKLYEKLLEVTNNKVYTKK